MKPPMHEKKDQYEVMTHQLLYSSSLSLQMRLHDIIEGNG